MNDLVSEVQETFARRAAEVPVPAYDETALRRRVRGSRRRRRTVRAGAVLAAAGVLAVATWSVGDLVADRREAGAASGTDGATDRTGTRSADPVTLPSPLYVVRGNRLVALTPDGAVTDLGVASEAVVGFTTEFVLALDDDSHLVRVDASPPAEGAAGPWTFRRVSAPVTAPTQSVALSSDGRWLGWIGLDDSLTVYDLKAGAVSDHRALPAGSYLASVADRAALVSVEGDLRLLSGSRSVPVPTARSGDGWASDVAGDYVAVADQDGVTRVYDVTAGAADLVTRVPGTGRLAGYGRGVVSVDEDAGEVRLWATGDPAGSAQQLRGVPGQPVAAGWLDEDHPVVTSRVDGGTAVSVCRVADRACSVVTVSDAEVALAE